MVWCELMQPQLELAHREEKTVLRVVEEEEGGAL